MDIYSIGGFNEVGKNMTLVDLGEDAFIFDCGLFLPPIVELEEKERTYSPAAGDHPPRPYQLQGTDGRLPQRRPDVQGPTDG